jgi:SAM-dependent methyltransferase
MPLEEFIRALNMIGTKGNPGRCRRMRLIRKKSMSETSPLDLDLINIVRDYPSHNFLMNPASQNIFLYLSRYVKVAAEYYFNADISDIKILDWGCGKGQVTYLLKKLGATIKGCDIRSDADDSSFGQKTPIMEACDIAIDPLEHEYNLPYNSDSIDVVLSFGVLEHVSNDSKSLKEINRVLRNPGLFFCFYLPYTLSWTQCLAHLRGNYYHDRLYSKSGILGLLDQSGFDLLDLWHRQLFPKNTIRYPQYRLFEKIDLFLTDKTPLKYFATNIEFVACKK